MEYSPVAHEDLVANINEAIKWTVQSSQRGRETFVTPVGPVSKTSDGKEIKTDFRKFVYGLLVHRSVPSNQAKYIAKNAWRDKTVLHKEGVLQRWLKFMQETKISEYDLRFDNIMSFLRTSVQSYAMVKRAKQMLVVLRKISGDPLKMGNIFLLEKYLSASFNTHPPGVMRPGSTWDVNVLLDYFVKLGPNEKITKSNILGGKLVLQLLLTQLCHSSEVAQLQMSMM